MPIHYYTWTTLLAGKSFSFRVLESSEEDARQQLIQSIEKFHESREKYEHFERQLEVNKQNQNFIEKKALDAYAVDDECQVESLERALQTIHNSRHRVQNEMQWFLGSLDIDTLGIGENVSPFSVHLDAVVRVETGEDQGNVYDPETEEITLRQFLLTAPKVTPFKRIEMYNNLWVSE